MLTSLHPSIHRWATRSTLPHLICLLLASCSAPAAEQQPTFAASGKVLYQDGQPLPGGIIQFISQREPTLNMSATIGDDGSFELLTLQGQTNSTGAIAGPCQVLVTLPFPPGGTPELMVLPKLLEVQPQGNEFVIHVDRPAPSPAIAP